MSSFLVIKIFIIVLKMVLLKYKIEVILELVFIIFGRFLQIINAARLRLINDVALRFSNHHSPYIL